MQALTLQFAPDHPAGPGHFPGNPIIPGALLLAAAARQILAVLGLREEGISVKSAKFFHPVRPGERVRVEFEHSGSGEIRFHCSVAETRVLAGVLHAAGA